MSELNVLQQIALSYAILETGRTDLVPEHLGFDSGTENDIEEDEDLIEEVFEGDIIGWVVGEVLGCSFYRDERKNWAEQNGLKELEQDGGGEGGGEYCYSVFSWQNKIYKIEYSYYSYDGHNYDDVEETLREVKPVEKVVTVYE